MPFKLKLMIAAATATGLLTLAAAVALGGHEGLGPLGELAAFTAVLTLGWLYPLRILRREETEAYQFDEALFVAMALLLPPLGIVLSFGVSALASQLIRRRPLSRIAFNTGVQLTATGLALAAMRLAGLHEGVGPRSMALVIGGAAIWLVINSAYVWMVLAILEGQSIWRSAVDSLGFRLVLWSTMVSIGLLCGLATSAYPWAVLLAVIPLAVVEVMLAGSLKARYERQQLDGLLRAAADAHASVEPADVEEAILGSARKLLACREARIRETPPGDGELGSRLPGSAYPERWLVVSDRRGVEPFRAHDATLLEALAGVSASALANAGLVEQLKHEAFHDALTGLPNQLLFEETVGLALAERRQPQRKLAVFVLDLDRFKRVNDSLGHPAGNELLREVAHRLSGAVRTGDTVARMSGDEFTLLVTGLRSTGEAAFVAEKALAVFQAPFLVTGQELYVPASLGVAVAPEDGTRPSVLLKNADTAMYRAKERGRNCFEIYSVDMNSAA